jgi:anaerobic selenocysteine-containing dehydrogenase
MDMSREPTTEEVYELMCAGSAIPLSRVRQYPHGALFEEARDVVGPRDPDCAARLQLADPVMLEALAAVRAEDPLARRRTGPDYPLLLIGRRMMTMNNSAPRADGLVRTGHNPAYMHPEELARLSLAPGDRVEIRSRHGAVTAFVEADPDVKPGVVSISHGFGAPPPGAAYDPKAHGANVNRLTAWDDDPDPYHGMPRMGALPVAVTPVSEQPAEPLPA